MSILVRGMELPVGCYYCHFVERLSSSCIANQSVTIDRDDWYSMRAEGCPLCEVPTPHGRLVDANELSANMYHDAFETDSDFQRWDSGCWVRYKLFEMNLNGAPTVIEADGKNGRMG